MGTNTKRGENPSEKGTREDERVLKNELAFFPQTSLPTAEGQDQEGRWQKAAGLLPAPKSPHSL